jgi:hypothetical protein
MQITPKLVARKLTAYLHHEISLSDLTDWAENVMMEGQISEKGYEQVRDVVARLGLADVRAFGLTWEDCEELLRRLGYSARIEVVSE